MKVLNSSESRVVNGGISIDHIRDVLEDWLDYLNP
jgi:hypothetical protein